MFRRGVLMSRPVAAAALTILGGLFVMVGGAAIALVGGILAAFLGSFSGLFLIGLLVGLLTVTVGLLMLVVPSGHSVWGILAILFALVSVPFALAGLIVGFVLALIGGILAILWRPGPVAPFITVDARVVPPPSG